MRVKEVRSVQGWRQGVRKLYAHPGDEYGPTYLGDIQWTEDGAWHATYGEAGRQLGHERFRKHEDATEALRVKLEEAGYPTTADPNAPPEHAGIF